MSSLYNTLEYKLISDFYGSKCAERSKVPLMNHIHEGADLLTKWGVNELPIRAYFIHPIVQSGTILSSNSVTRTAILSMATEYSRIANKYLCRPETDELTNMQDETELQFYLGYMSKDCAWMLLADKVQNQADFRKYHWFSHDRAIQLEKYFNLWIKTLRTYYL